MDRSHYGRCHPDNIWAMSGLADCLRARLRESAVDAIKTELSDLERKIQRLRVTGDSHRKPITAACACAQKFGQNSKCNY